MPVRPSVIHAICYWLLSRALPQHSNCLEETVNSFKCQDRRKTQTMHHFPWESLTSFGFCFLRFVLAVMVTSGHWGETCIRQTETFIRRICGPWFPETSRAWGAGEHTAIPKLQPKFPWMCKLDNLGPQTMPAINSVVQDEITIYNSLGWCTVWQYICTLEMCQQDILLNSLHHIT